MMANFRWLIRFIFVDGWPNIFAILAIIVIVHMLLNEKLSIQSQTRLEDFLGMIIGYYFLSNPKTNKTADTIQTMAETQKHLATNAAPAEGSADVIRSGDPVTVQKTEE